MSDDKDYRDVWPKDAVVEIERLRSELEAYKESATMRLPISCDQIEWSACMRWFDSMVQRRIRGITKERT